MAEDVNTDITATTLPVLPLSSGVALPQMVLTIAAETPEARAAVAAADKVGAQLLLVPKTPDGRYARVGAVARIEDRGNLPNGTPALVVRAVARATVGRGVLGETAALWVQAEVIDEPDLPDEQARELTTELRAALRALFEDLGGPRLSELIRGVDDPGALADMAGWWPDLSFDRKVELLETVDVVERVQLVLKWVKDALAEVELTDRIRKDVTDGMEKTQREFLLRQQMQAIRKELGEDDAEDDLVDGYREKLASLRADGHLTDAAGEAIEREINRFERTPAQNMEHGWIRDWLDTVFEVPWAERTTDSLDVDDARRILDEDHTGLEEVKDRIVEFLAVRKLRAERGLDDKAAASDDGGEAAVAVTPGRRPGAIVSLVGPPGVGKTSLGTSIARALGRKFVRVALGGVRDEAEIRGHRRTYVGARAGRLVKAIQEAGTMNPVVLLDEVDKLGADWRGDPSSALLEVLDPAQNHTFRDHYLEVDLDLSDVLFIATANVLDTIPGPLLDRMEIIGLDGYTEAEKVAIARDHLLARQVVQNGLRSDEVVVTDDALAEVVNGYTREAGVRSLERQIGKLLRKTATQVAAGKATPITVDRDQVTGLLGRRRFHDETAARVAVPGVATGLAVTGAGGDVLFVEATSMPGESGLTVTGQLGDVMKESAQIALSYVRSRAARLGIDPAAFENRRFHVHFPAGAIPKDGPSAGITMATALVSLLTDRPVRPTVGMTGELTLQGRVLPIGGVKQKVLAAHRAGLTEVILPKRNGADLEDVPERVRDEMTFYLADTVDDVL
ncbi:MAG TPA: endopeptidase La, partial [Acidimicrobiales bacterium]|nr:endopeptidase La [Acidimicrobiales bacterium]